MDLQTGELITLKITDFSGLGKGFGRSKSGKKVFVAKTCPGDHIKAKVIKENSKLVLADLVTIDNPSDLRLTPPCHYFSECGGCELQHLKPDSYQKFKKSIIDNSIARNNLKLDCSINWIWIGQASRRRVAFNVDRDNKIGFFRDGTNLLVPIDNCLMLEEELSVLIVPLKDLLTLLPKNLISKVLLTKFDNGVGVIFCVHTGALINIKQDSLILFAKKNKLLNLALQDGDNLLMVYKSLEPQLVWGKLTVNPPSNLFLQATKRGEASIINEIVTFAKTLPKLKLVADLYAGVGTYSFALTDFFTEHGFKIDAFEGNKTMVSSINRNAMDNNLRHRINGSKRDLVLNPLSTHELEKYDLVLLNPSRNGANSQVKLLAKSKVKNIVVVSCEPYSFAADAKLLVDAGYKITNFTAIDQFYYTHHLEVVGIFQR